MRRRISARAAVSAAVSAAIRTTPAPAAAKCSTWATVASTSAVFVAHMLCTTIGWPPPMVTEPTRTGRVGLRRAAAVGGRSSGMEPFSPVAGRQFKAWNVVGHPASCESKLENL